MCLCVQRGIDKNWTLSHEPLLLLSVLSNRANVNTAQWNVGGMLRLKGHGMKHHLAYTRYTTNTIFILINNINVIISLVFTFLQCFEKLAKCIAN